MQTAPLVLPFSSAALPSSTRAVFERGEPEAFAALGRALYPYLAALPDPRGRRGRRYPLSVLLVLSLVGLCTGCQGYLSIARWVRELKPEVLRELGLQRRSTPGAATWLNLLRVLDWDGVTQQFHAWAEALHAAARVEADPPAPVPAPAPAVPDAPVAADDPAWEGFAIDGKTLRGSRAAGAEIAHVVSVVAHSSRVSLCDVGVREKEGELTVTPDLLAAVLRPGRVITADALFTQRALCRQIRAADAHYLLIVKGNQPQLRAAVKAVLGTVSKQEAKAQQRRSTHTVDCGHGRIENRFLVLAAVTPAEVPWPGVQQVFCLERRRYQPARGGKPARSSRELVYGITSLAPAEAGPATVLRLQRGHWSIENNVHWVLDTFFREDERRIRDGRIARGVAALRRGALNLLRQLGGRTVAATADRVKADPTILLPLIGLVHEN